MSSCQDIRTRLSSWLDYLSEVGFDTEALGRHWFEQCSACREGAFEMCSGPALRFGDAELVVCRDQDIIAINVTTSWGPDRVVSHALTIVVNDCLVLELQFGPHGHRCEISNGGLGYPWASLPLDLILATDVLIYSLFPRVWARNRNRSELVRILRCSEDDFIRPLVRHWLNDESSLFIRSVCST